MTDDTENGGNETFGNRAKATDAMRDRSRILTEKAKRLTVEATEWWELASALDEIEKHTTQKEGEDTGPSIGVGSAAERLLWKVAVDYQEKV